MKKIVFALVVLMLAAPAWAEVLINCAEDPCDSNCVIVSFVNSEGQHVRAFSLDITVDGKNFEGGAATISAVECLSADYYVYPGSVQISGNEVTNAGSCVCDDSYDDTLPGPPDSNGVTIEMASLYNVNDVEHPDEPADSGDLVKICINGCGTIAISISANEIRGKVVMENATSVEPNAPGCVLDLPACTCIAPDDEPLYSNWVAAGSPDCWCPEYECQGLGDTDGDCDVDTADITVLIAGWNVYLNGPCADTDKDGDVDTADITNLLVGWNSGCGACTPVP